MTWPCNNLQILLYFNPFFNSHNLHYFTAHSLHTYLKHSFHTHRTMEISLYDHKVQPFGQNKSSLWTLNPLDFLERHSVTKETPLTRLLFEVPHYLFPSASPLSGLPICHRTLGFIHRWAGSLWWGLRRWWAIALQPPLSPPPPHTEHHSTPNMWFNFGLKYYISQNLLFKK